MSTPEERYSKIMKMKATGPSLTPIARPRPFLDYLPFSQKELDYYNQLIDSFLDNGTVSPVSHNKYYNLMIVARERRRQHALQGEIESCIPLDQIIRQLSELYLEQSFFESKAAHVAAIEYQIEILKSELEEAKARWKYQTKQLQSKQERSSTNIIYSNMERLSAHDSTIPSTLPVQYCKLSPDLLDLREREKYLIASRRYQEAQVFHNEFLKRQKEELTQKKRDFAKSFEAQRTEKEKKGARMLSANRDRYEERTQNNDSLKDREINGLKAALSNLERKLILAKSEYIGEDDPIVRGEKRSFSESQRSIIPTSTQRSLKTSSSLSIKTQPISSRSAREMSQSLARTANPPDSRRWPRPKKPYN